MGKLEGRVALITGGARGQGRSHALTLAGEGADIVMVDNCIVDVPFQGYPGGSKEQFDETKEMVEALGRRCIAVVGDVRVASDLEGAVAQAHEQLGSVDIAVANAGLAPELKVLEEVDPDLWKMTLDVNLTGVFNTIRSVLPGMVSRRYGRIVATSSMAGRGGFAHAGAYCASKWGVIGLIKVVANEYGRHGITANAICPTNVDSPMVHNPGTYQVFVPEVENPTREQALERMAQHHPMGVPYVEPRDISQAILFLVSDEARYVSGDALTVSAGSAARNSA